MSGRERRKRGAIDLDDDDQQDEGPPPTCWLCLRPLGEKVDNYHPVPKSRGGRATVAVHPICRRTIETVFTNAELARGAGEREKLIEHPEIVRFLGWVAGKGPDFDAPTAPRRKR
ncbi:HNH endonuclease [Novosphingobium sp.]|uniref:HNH endonuclease n=1 Tax=Novosphingobium sp. TaxID=1874826 RepID=UPI00333E7017